MWHNYFHNVKKKLFAFDSSIFCNETGWSIFCLQNLLKISKKEISEDGTLIDFYCEGWKKKNCLSLYNCKVLDASKNIYEFVTIKFDCKIFEKTLLL